MLLAIAFAAAWIGWLAIWAVLARGLAPNDNNVPPAHQMPSRLLQVLGLSLIVLSANNQFLPDVTLWQSTVASWIFFALLLAGLAFATWARLHLGAMWSSSVVIKKDQRIVRSGPYGLVRHPIYTGVLFGLLASALAIARLDALIGLIIFSIGMFWKARLEEDILEAQCPAGDYEGYRRKVPMLIPFWPVNRA